MIFFTVDNSRTTLTGSDPNILFYLDRELRYPTALAVCKEKGMVLPGDEQNNSWDGWMRMLRVPKKSPPWLPTGLVFQAVAICQRYGYPVQIQDAREKPEGDIPELKSILLRDYQKEAVEAALHAGRGVIDIVPRGGKTRISCEITRRLALPTLWLAPTDRIVKQTYGVLEGFFGENYAYHLVGSANQDKAKYKRIVVCTAATAVNLSQEFYNTRKCLISDEFHHSSAPTHRNIFKKCDHIYYRFGMTGTFFRSGDDAMAMHALLSQTIYKVTSKQLLDLGHLVPTHVVFLPTPGPKLRGVENSFNGGHGKYGIHEHSVRNQLSAHTASFLCQAGYKVLVLVGTKKQGYMIEKIINSFLPGPPDGADFKTAEFISTDKKRYIQGRILDSFEAGQEVKILIGTSILGEGVDLPSADALVLAKGEKAEVTLTQAMYRVCTAQEGKTHALVVDFADRHHRKLLEHSMERARVYYEEPIFSVKMLNDPSEFPGWLKLMGYK